MASEQDLDLNRNTPMHLAAAQNRLKDVRAEIDRNYGVDRRNHLGWTPLMLAARNGHEEIVDLLLDKRANASLKNGYGSTVFEMAIASGKLNLVKKILQHLLCGGVSRQSLQSHRSPICTAAVFDHPHLLPYLLESQFDPNAVDADTNVTPLMMSSSTGNLPMCNTLIQSGAHLHLKNINNQSAMDLLQELKKDQKDIIPTPEAATSSLPQRSSEPPSGLGSPAVTDKSAFETLSTSDESSDDETELNVTLRERSHSEDSGRTECELDVNMPQEEIFEISENIEVDTPDVIEHYPEPPPQPDVTTQPAEEDNRTPHFKHTSQTYQHHVEPQQPHLHHPQPMFDHQHIMVQPPPPPHQIVSHPLSSPAAYHHQYQQAPHQDSPIPSFIPFGMQQHIQLAPPPSAIPGHHMHPHQHHQHHHQQQCAMMSAEVAAGGGMCSPFYPSWGYSYAAGWQTPYYIADRCSPRNMVSSPFVFAATSPITPITPIASMSCYPQQVFFPSDMQVYSPMPFDSFDPNKSMSPYSFQVSVNTNCPRDDV